VPHSSASFTFIDGDGTVPTESATAHGLEATATVGVPGVSHRDLVASSAVWDLLLAWLREPLPDGDGSASTGAVGGGGSSVVYSSRTSSLGGGVGDSMSGGSSTTGLCGSAVAASVAQQWPAAESAELEECFWNPLAWQALLA